MADNTDETQTEDPVTPENTDTEGIMQEAQRLKHKVSQVSMDYPTPPDNDSSSDPFEWDFDEEQPITQESSAGQEDDPDTTIIAADGSDDNTDDDDESSNNNNNDSDDNSDNVIVSSDEDGEFSYDSL